ncbi:MAG: DUF4349 domain-containing protein [Methanoregula sp.]|nr:DUF4349 domain-containing protein [Methanoregula sp.]
MNFKIIAILAVCIAMVAATGCMGINSVSSDKSSPAQEVVSIEDSGLQQSGSNIAYAGRQSELPMPTSGPSQSGTGTAISDTKIIRTAYLSIEVNDVSGSVETIKTLVSQKGGYISSTNIQKNYNNRLSGSVIIRVPASEFDSTLTGIKAIGTVKSISTQGQDITEEYVDLQAQKTSYQNQLAQYNEIMKKAEKVEDVILVQQQIDRVQTELNRLEGRLKYLDNRIDLSIITVNLQEPEPVGGETGHSFVSTINNGIAGFVGMIDAIIIILFTLLPLIIVGGIGYGIYRWRKGRKIVVPPEKSEKE